MLVIPDYTFNSPGSIRLNKRSESARRTSSAADSGLETGVAGGAAELNDYSRVTRERMPWVIIAITIVTFLVLMVVLRAMPLAAIAVGLNLLTVGVAFGVLTLLFHVPDRLAARRPQLRRCGRGDDDLRPRLRPLDRLCGLPPQPHARALRRPRATTPPRSTSASSSTAGVITGAAAIMMAVFIAFAGAPIATVSQLGVGLTVAVILDATVVRIVLLPALMLLLGDRVWWLPKPLERVIPKLSV